MIAPQASAAFAAAVEKVLDIYSQPYDARRPERHNYEYERCDACNVFMTSEPLAGRHLTKSSTERRTKLDLAVFVQDIASSYPDAERITLVMDNLNTLPQGSLYEAFTSEKAKAL